MRLPKPPPTQSARRDTIALVLAAGLVLALNLITIGVMVAAATQDNYTLSENATQILTGWGGGIIGVLGAVFGYGAGQSAGRNEAANGSTGTETDTATP